MDRKKTQRQQSHSERAANMIKDVRISDDDSHPGLGAVGHVHNSGTQQEGGREGGRGERRMAPQSHTNKHARFKEPKNDQGAGNSDKHSQRLPSGPGRVSKSRPVSFKDDPPPAQPRPARPSTSHSESLSTDATTVTVTTAGGYSDEVATLFRIDPSEHDDRGRCVRHPQVRLRKKRIFGGWKSLLAACPECCIGELRRMRALKDLERESERGARGAEHDPVAITLVGNIGREEKRGKHKRSKNKTRRPSLQMEWVDDKGRHGVYDGQINKDLVPHGKGRMVYDHDGSVKEGTWKNGRYRRTKSRRHHHSDVGSPSGLQKSGQSKTLKEKSYRKRPTRGKEWEYYH